MSDTPSPGLLFPVTVACQCGWRGIELDRAGAFDLWVAHVRRSGHDMTITGHHIQEDQ